MAQRLAATKFTPPIVPLAVQQLLQVVAYIIFIMWAIKIASHVLSIVLMGIMLGYCFLLFVNWIMRRGQLRKNTAIALSLIVMATFSLLLVFSAWRAAANMRARLPIYEEQVIGVAAFAESMGMKAGNLSERRAARIDQLFTAAQAALPDAASFLGNVALMFLLGMGLSLRDGARTGRQAKPPERNPQLL